MFPVVTTIPITNIIAMELIYGIKLELKILKILIKRNHLILTF